MRNCLIHSFSNHNVYFIRGSFTTTSFYLTSQITLTFFSNRSSTIYAINLILTLPMKIMTLLDYYPTAYYVPTISDTDVPLNVLPRTELTTLGNWGPFYETPSAASHTDDSTTYPKLLRRQSSSPNQIFLNKSTSLAILRILLVSNSRFLRLL